MAEWKPREADVDRFTTGDCHIFALALSKLTGWPTYAFEDSFDGQPYLHAFVVAPDGWIYDVEGRHDPTEFKKSWSHDIYRAYDFYEYDWTSPCFGYYSRRRAAALAKRLVQHYGL